MSLLKFCDRKNFKFLEQLSNSEKKVCIGILKTIEGNKNIMDKIVKKENFELLKTFFFKEKYERGDEWIIKSRIGKPGKDGTGYIVYHKDDLEKE